MTESLKRLRWLVGAASLVGVPGFVVAAPVLYSAPAHESPVRADPDDLLLLPGDGLSASDRVAYRSARGVRGIAAHPAASAVPAEPTATIGYADVVGTSDVPRTLTIRLPRVLAKDDPYLLCVLTRDGEWSNCVRINDARPLWFSPDFAYTTGSVADLPRVLKVIGRNLQPVTRGQTRVRLTGPRTYTLTAQDASASLQRHVAQVDLPTPMPAGNYSVEVSRDGESWVPLLSETRKLVVLERPAAVPTVAVRDCEPDDATSCIVKAVEAAADKAKYPHGATVQFEARTYKLQDPGQWSATGDASSRHVDFEGILVPKHVNLRGAGPGASIIERGKGWVTTRNARGAATTPITSLFNLQGDNTVEGLTFSDENVYSQNSTRAIAALALGVGSLRARSMAPRAPTLSHIIISHNEFKGPFVGIQGLGLPIDHLLVTHNTVAAYENGLYINRWGNTQADNPFAITDSVVAYNVFHPSSHDAVIASQIGGGQRLDFSNNIANGSSVRYLYQATDRKGFRAAFFWNLTANNELNLISRNEVLCSGDKPGDGEAIVLDDSYAKDYGGFERAVPVSRKSRSDGTAVTVEGRPIPGPLGFVGLWLQVVQGPGLGQLRKITGYRNEAEGPTFTVQPAFDVAPREGSVVTVGLQNWQAYIIENRIDQSSPTCVNGPKREPTGGELVFYSQTADSVIEGNEQIATTGILLTSQYVLNPGDVAYLMLQSSNEIRDNRIERGPVFGGLRGKSGIRAFYVVTPEPGASPPPPVLAFATVIAGNRITGADDVDGAIQFEAGGPVGFLNSGNGCAARWNLGSAPLVFHNELRNSRGIDINSRDLGHRPATCHGTVRDSLTWHAALYGNTCTEVGPRSFVDYGTLTQRICPSGRAGSCECAEERP